MNNNYITLDLTDDELNLLTVAASICAMSVEDFILEHAVTAAEELLEKENTYE